MRTLQNITTNQMRSLLKNHKNNIIDKSKYLKDIEMLEYQLSWPKRDKAFIVVTKDVPSPIIKDSDPRYREIMFIQESIAQLQKEIDLVDAFISKTKKICNEEDNLVLDMFVKAERIERIANATNYSTSGVLYRVTWIINEVLRYSKQS